MKNKKIVYTDEPMGRMKLVKDFLPSPNQLVLKEDPLEKRYQVFVSSTYVDLKEERSKVIQTLMMMDCIPSGMELFPAVDEEQFAFIKKVIDDCDYYLLIIGGRYGSVTAEGISYTEKEYDYALEKGLKIIAFLHEKPEEIAFGKSEADPVLRERLRVFREKVATGRVVKLWNKPEELQSLVAMSLLTTIKAYPATGWARADKITSGELLSEVNELRKENDRLKLQVNQLSSENKPAAEGLAGLDEYFEIRYTHYYGNRKILATKKMTWKKIFGTVSPYLAKSPSDKYVKSILESEIDRNSDHRSVTIDDQDFQTIQLQLGAQRLVTVNYSQTTQGGMALFWNSTPRGNTIMLDIRTIKSASNPATQTP